MTRTTKVLKRLGVAAVAVATIGAGAPALVAGAAQAAGGPTTRLAITPTSSSGPAGSCLAYTVTATDATGANPSDTPTVTVSLTQNPAYTGTIGFCDPTSSTATTPTTAGSPQTGVAPTTSNPNGTAATTSQNFGTKANSSTGVVSATFGVYSSAAGSVDVRASETSNALVQSNTATAVYTAGGNNAAKTIKDVTTSPGTVVAGGSQNVDLQVLDANGKPLPGVSISYQYTSGANAPTTQPTTYPTCTGQTDANGKLTCAVPVAKAGTDTFTFWVDQTSTTNATSPGPDQGEPQVTVTRTTYPAPNTDVSQARNISVTPSSTTTAPGATKSFVVKVVDAAGKAVQGVGVIADITSGPGRFTSNNGTGDFGTTDGLGQVTFTTTTFTSESGTQALRFAIYTGTTANECGNAAGSPTAGDPAGNCTTVAENVITAASPTPSSSTTPPSGRSAATLEVITPTIQAGQTAKLVGHGAANEAYQLQCYTRPSSTYKTARSGAFNAAGDPVTFTLSLGMNTRCFLQYATNSTQGASPSVVVNVKTVISIFPVRNSTRNYTFQGHNMPKYAGQLITLYYVNSNGDDVRKGFVKTDSTGIYHIPVTFVSNGTFTFFVRTGQTLTNAAGESNHVSVTIH